MTASRGILVIRSSLIDWRSMKKECRHARHTCLSIFPVNHVHLVHHVHPVHSFQSILFCPSCPVCHVLSNFPVLPVNLVYYSIKFCSSFDLLHIRTYKYHAVLWTPSYPACCTVGFKAEMYRDSPPPSLWCCARNILTVQRETLTQYIIFKR